MRIKTMNLEKISALMAQIRAPVWKHWRPDAANGRHDEQHDDAHHSQNQVDMLLQEMADEAGLDLQQVSRRADRLPWATGGLAEQDELSALARHTLIKCDGRTRSLRFLAIATSNWNALCVPERDTIPWIRNHRQNAGMPSTLGLRSSPDQINLELLSIST